MVATAGVPLDQTPVPTPSDKVTEAPTQTNGLAGKMATGVVNTVITSVV